MAARMSKPVISYQNSSNVGDLLSPPLVMSLADGRCYRKVVIDFGGAELPLDRSIDNDRTNSPSTAVLDSCHDDDDEGCCPDLGPVDQLPNGGYSIKLDIPSQFYKFIIGYRGNTKASIEKETKTKIRVPSSSSKGFIVVEGASKSSLGKAKMRIEVVTWSNRLKVPVTHFICIPLNEPSIMERVEVFKRKALQTCSKDRGVDEEVFQLPAKLHLTLGTLRLFSEEEQAKAESVLQECLETARPVLGDEMPIIALHGVECMKDDPTAVDVLFAKVSLTDSTDRLQRYVDEVIRCFYERAPDIMEEMEGRGVKLHATIMNSTFRRSSSPVKPNRKRYESTFDCRGIMKEFASFDFGQVPLTGVHLSKRGEYDANGFYRCIRHYPIQFKT